MPKKKKSDKAEVVTSKRSPEKVCISINHPSHRVFQKSVKFVRKPV